MTSLINYLHDVFVTRFDAWVAMGFVAQGLFTMRFIVQWIASERARASVVPVAFWFFSLGGGVLLLSYALYRRDPVFIAGQTSVDRRAPAAALCYRDAVDPRSRWKNWLKSLFW